MSSEKSFLKNIIALLLPYRFYDYIIIITHRNKILEKVDRIIQLENGVVISDRIVQQDAAK